MGTPRQGEAAADWQQAQPGSPVSKLTSVLQNKGLTAEVRWRMRKASLLEEKLERARKLLSMDALERRAQQLTPEPLVRSSSELVHGLPAEPTAPRFIKTLGNLRSATDQFAADKGLFFFPAHQLRSSAWGPKEFAQTTRAGQLLKSRRLQFVTGALEKPEAVQGTLQHELSGVLPGTSRSSPSPAQPLGRASQALPKHEDEDGSALPDTPISHGTVRFAATSQQRGSSGRHGLQQTSESRPIQPGPASVGLVSGDATPTSPSSSYLPMPAKTGDFSQLLQLESLDAEVDRANHRAAAEEAALDAAEQEAADAMLSTLEREQAGSSMTVFSGSRNTIIAATAWRPAANHIGLTRTLRMKVAAADLVYDDALDSPAAVAARSWSRASWQTPVPARPGRRQHRFASLLESPAKLRYEHMLADMQDWQHLLEASQQALTPLACARSAVAVR